MPTPIDQEIVILILTALCGWPWIHIALAYHEILTRRKRVYIGGYFREDE